MTPPVIQRWLEFIDNTHDGDVSALLAADAVFYSPAVFTPQEGRDKTAAYLGAAAKLFGGGEFRYVNQWYGERSAVLEFVADLDGVHVNGIDMIEWNDAEEIVSFKVMLRPFKALQAVMPKMAELLGQ
ncbi:nuclear transport factor 2 family protein [Mycolicibacterium sp. S2-37]|uniref:nuclear transport factor 2 family protein n=1 Tax=Mycolicibacterium sp. S2-37 TaxID=2810297 RepID=UPI001A941151|nr:nuclear transport factor 2 family protein [Mycolicibacterium sp. S2-37]MBO0681139.1 nuclear transport factor 2 family protein [Mycolicibacterium sp. S2-37]